MSAYTRKCPECGKEQVYKHKRSVWNAEKRKSTCSDCFHVSRVGIPSGMLGKVGYWIGKKFSKTHKSKLSISHKNQETWASKNRDKMSKMNTDNSYWKGKTHSEETKRKIRIGKLKWLEENNIPSCQDKGAKEYFQWLNMYGGYNFQPKTFMDIGYVADGYDQSTHVWIEYDTPYHNTVGQKKKDLIRQTNIIKHFESINNPLTEFIRVKADGFGKVLETNSVYKG